MPEMQAGHVSHVYTGINVMIVDAKAAIKKGDKIHIKGSTTDLETVVDSMQFNHADIETAKKGQQVGIKVPEKVHEGDKVYVVT